MENSIQKVAALVVGVFSLSLSAETLDITGAPLGIVSARVPSVSILTADVATVTGGQYTSTADGTRSVLDITGGTWSSWNPGGTSSVMTFGPIDDTAKTTLNGPVTFCFSGSATRLVTKAPVANCGTLRFELSDGASWLNTNTFAVAANQYRKGDSTVIMKDASFSSVGGAINLGCYESDINCGRCSLYVTNSSFTVWGAATPVGWAHAYFNMGTYVYSDSTVSLAEASDYAVCIGTGADLLLCDGTEFTGRIRVGGKKPSSLTVDDATATIGRLNVGTDSSSVTASVHLVKGTADCSDYVCLCPSEQPAWVDLQGCVLQTRQIYGGANTHRAKPSGKGFARLTADGAKIVCTASKNVTALIRELDLAEIGAKGLTLDSNGYDCTVNQDFVNVAGENGCLLKKGSGALTLKVPTVYSVSETCVENGSLVVSADTADAAVTLATEMIVTNGAILSTVGNVKTLTVDALAVDGAKLRLDPGDTVVVTGNASFKNLTLSFSAVPALNEAKDILTVQGTISPESVEAFKTAVVDNTFPAGTYGKLTARTTEDGTVLTITTKTSPVVSGETKWRGPGTAWSDDANWTDGAPTETTEATFDEATAPAQVTVSAAADVGVLSFEAGSFTLQGTGPLTLAAPGASFVTVATGVHTVDVALVQEAATPVTVAADSALTLAKSVTGGSLSKSGTGLLTLSGVNAFAGPLSIAAGMLSADNAGALTGVGTLSLGDATLETTKPIVLASSTVLTTAASAANKAVVVKNEDDLTVSAVTMGTGCLLKRGLGTLTIDATSGKCGTLANNMGCRNNDGSLNPSSNIAFPEDGTPPSGGYAGFTVLEGETVVRGTAQTPVVFNGPINVGMHSSAARTNPVLTFDGVSATCQGSVYSLVVGYVAEDNANALYPTLRVLNGAQLTIPNIILSENYNTSARYPQVAVTNATVTMYSPGSSPELSFSNTRQGTGYGAVMAREAKLYSPGFSIGGCTRSRVSASVLSTADGGYAQFRSDRNVRGEILFDEGTLLKVNAFNMTDYYCKDGLKYGGLFVFAFDNATWDIGPDNLKIDSSNVYQGKPEHWTPKKFEVRAGGLNLKVASGKTLQSEAPFIGCGPLSLTGGGTLKFDAGAFALTGTVDVVNGTVDLASVASVSNNVIKGSGTVSGAAFVEGIVLDPQLAADWTVGAAPTFANCTFADRVTVACGHGTEGTETLPKNALVVAHYVGAAPDVSRWRVKDVGGKNIRGTFVAENGDIKMNLSFRGLTVIVR